MNRARLSLIRRLCLIVLAALLVVLGACAPKTAPVPVTTAPSAPQSTLTPASARPSVSPEDAAWAKVVEAAKKEGKVNAYSFAWIGDAGAAIAKAFKERYGITVEVTTGRGAETVERIKTEKRIGLQVGDMVQTSTVLVNTMKLQGLLASVGDELPSLRERGVWWVEPTSMDPQYKGNLTLVLTWFTPYVNTKLVNPQEIPQVWRDLLEPKWNGKMGASEARLSTSMSEVMVGLTDNKVWDEDYIRALYRQNLHFYVSQPGMFAALSRGEINLVVDGSDTSASRFAQDGASIQAIDMKDGVVGTTGSVAAVAGGPNPNATRVFLNWLFSQEGQSVASKALGVKMVRRDVPDFRPKAIQAPITKPLVITVEQGQKATQLFQDKWFDKVVGR